MKITYRSKYSYAAGEFRKYLLRNYNLHQEILTQRCLNWWIPRVKPQYLKVTIVGQYKTDPPSTIVTEAEYEGESEEEQDDQGAGD